MHERVEAVMMTNYTVACKAANYYDGASAVDDNNE